ncbi:MAG: EamA family transporter [Bdellovibrionales bacterium]
MLASFSWGIYALIASMSWGLIYVLSEKILRAGVSPVALQLFLGLVSMPVYIGLFLMLKNRKEDLQIVSENLSLLWPIIITGALVVVANLLILFAVQEKNATLVSFLEITYPIFTFIFAMWILGDTQLTVSTLVGAGLIALGTGTILLKG